MMIMMFFFFFRSLFHFLPSLTKKQTITQGLFSRITFREPVFLGGIGNITGLNKKLPVTHGMIGCIRKFVANEHEYNFQQAPYGDVSQGFNIRKCYARSKNC